MSVGTNSMEFCQVKIDYERYQARCAEHDVVSYKVSESNIKMRGLCIMHMIVIWIQQTIISKIRKDDMRSNF